VTECKNTRHKQVHHCLLKMYKQAVISVSKLCNYKPAHLPMLARPATNPFNIGPSLRTKLCKPSCSKHPPLVPLQTAPEQPSFAPNQPLFNGVLRQKRSISGKSAQGVKKTWQSAIYSGTMVHHAPLLSTGFEGLPALPLSSVPFRFLKSLDLSSSKLRLGYVPLCFDWQLVE